MEAIVEEANRERADELKLRERLLAQRETRLVEMRAELERLIAENETLRKQLESRVAMVNTANNERIQRLVGMYEKMDPQEAANILNTVQEPVALNIFAGMKGKSAAGIMEFIPTDKAARLSEKLSKPR